MDYSPEMWIRFCKRVRGLGVQGEAYRFGRFCLQFANIATDELPVAKHLSIGDLFAPQVHPVWYAIRPLFWWREGMAGASWEGLGKPSPRAGVPSAADFGPAGLCHNGA